MQNTLSASTLKQTVFVLTAALGLAACGGGGGGQSHSPQTQAAPTPPAVQNQDAAKPSAPAPQNQNDAAKPSAPSVPKNQDVAKPSAPQAQPPVSQNPDPAKPSAPPAAAPQDTAKPAIPADGEVFSRLNLYDANQGVTATDILKLTLPENGKNITLTLLRPEDGFVGQPVVDTLRDADGRLLGYFGYANVNQVGQNAYGEKHADLRAYYLQNMDDRAAARPAGDKNINYFGKMYFHYPENSLNDVQTADVQATYFGGEKKMSMELVSNSDRSNRWYLFDQRGKYAQDGSGRKRSDRVDVDERGGVTGHLLFDENGTRDKLVPNGHFIGGFYGKNGGVLSGKAVNEYGEKWEGVLGATVVEPK